MSERPRRLLLVEDEPSVVKMVKKKLEVEGFEVLVAVDGREAMTKTQAKRPDLIILDVMLPHVSGFEVCDKLKKDPQSRDIPIIIYTGKGKEGDEKLCQELGADAYVNKLEGTTTLIERVHALLGGPRKGTKP